MRLTFAPYGRSRASAWEGNNGRRLLRPIYLGPCNAHRKHRSKKKNKTVSQSIGSKLQSESHFFFRFNIATHTAHALRALPLALTLRTHLSSFLGIHHLAFRLDVLKESFGPLSAVGNGDRGRGMFAAGLL